MAKEISSRHVNVNIDLVDDLNDTLSYKKDEFRIDNNLFL